MPQTAETPVDALKATVLFAMPVGPPYGGMTSYTAMLQTSALFADQSSQLLDTTPAAASRKGLVRVLQSIRRTLAVFSMVRQRRFDVVQFMTSDFLGFFEKGVMAIAAQMAGSRAVLHLVGGFVEFYATAGWNRPIIRWLLGRMDAVIAVHPDVAAYIQRIAPGAEIWVIPNPVVCGRIPPAPVARVNTPPRVLFTGSLRKAKGVLDLLEVARRIRDRGVAARFIIVGEGPEAAECQAFVRTHHLEDTVELPGFVDDERKAQLLRECDLYCLPTYSEGTPISVLEAMAASLPIVSTTVGGVPFAVTHGEHGWLVRPGDLAGIERAVLHLIASPRARAEMGCRGWKRAHEAFDLEIVVRVLIRRLNRLAGRSTHRNSHPVVAS